MNHSDQNKADALVLTPLTPKYIAGEHEIYFKLLKDVLPPPPGWFKRWFKSFKRRLKRSSDSPNNISTHQSEVLNIALAGPYGSGKSSILSRLHAEYPKRVISLSLSTLDPSTSQESDEITAQSTLPRQAFTKTNQIQKEFVKQLLYCERSHIMPDSRFNRLTKPRLAYAHVASGIIGVGVIFLLTITGFVKTAHMNLLEAVPLKIFASYPWVISFILWVVVASAISFLYRKLRSRFFIKQISTVGANVTLSADSPSYFDQYLDEIIYFFECTAYDIVVIEDIDRFDDSRILETLHALNSVLNKSKQIGRPIRFIYAVRDSIFENSADRSSDEEKIGDDSDHQSGSRDSKYNSKKPLEMNEDTSFLERSNRTKFFDLIIPVVPFVNHQNARASAKNALSEVYPDVPIPLLNIISAHVTDMRLLKNIRNEFIVYRERVIFGGNASKMSTGDDGNNSLALSEKNLLALIVYKNTHYRAFEKIRLGESPLDELYDRSRDFVAENRRRIEEAFREDEQRLKNVDMAKENAKRLNFALSEYSKRMRAQVRPQNAELGELRVRWNGKQQEDEVLSTSEFWSEYFQNEGTDIELVGNVKNPERRGHPWNDNLIFTLPRNPMPHEFEGIGEPERWCEEQRDSLKQKLKESQRLLKILKRAEFHELANTRGLYSALGVDGPDKSLNFAEIIEKTVDSPLASKLIKAGYIDQYFTLYTSVYQTNIVSIKARNFIVHHLDKLSPRIDYPLDSDDIEQLLGECEFNPEANSAWHNVSILNYFLEQKDESKLEQLFKALSNAEKERLEILEAYLSNDESLNEMVARLTPFLASVFTYLTAHQILSHERKIALMNTALLNLSPTLDYEVNDDFRDIVEEEYGKMEVFTQPSISSEIAETIARLLKEGRVLIGKLANVSDVLRQKLTSNNLYRITTENLRCVLGENAPISLDALNSSPKVYQHVLNHLTDYFHATEGMESITSDYSNVMDIVNDVSKVSIPHAKTVIERMSEACEIEQIDFVDKELWDVLLENNTLKFTPNNIREYIEVKDYNREILINYFKANKFTWIDVEKSDKNTRRKVGVAILELNAEKELSVERRVELVIPLNVKLPVEALPYEEGPLYGLLLDNGVIEESESLFKEASRYDWATLEGVLAHFTDLEPYLNRIELYQNIVRFLKSPHINRRWQDLMWAQVDDFVDHISPKQVPDFINLAIERGRTFEPNVVRVLAKWSKEPTLIFRLLPEGPELLNVDELQGVLVALGGDYEQLTTPNFKTVKLEWSEAIEAVLSKLKEQGYVDSFTKIDGIIKVIGKSP